MASYPTLCRVVRAVLLLQRMGWTAAGTGSVFPLSVGLISDRESHYPRPLVLFRHFALALAIPSNPWTTH